MNSSLLRFSNHNESSIQMDDEDPLQPTQVMELKWESLVNRHRDVYRPYLKDKVAIDVRMLYDEIAVFIQNLSSEESIRRNTLYVWFTRGLYKLHYEKSVSERAQLQHQVIPLQTMTTTPFTPKETHHHDKSPKSQRFREVEQEMDDTGSIKSPSVGFVQGHRMHDRRNSDNYPNQSHTPRPTRKIRFEKMYGPSRPETINVKGLGVDTATYASMTKDTAHPNSKQSRSTLLMKFKKIRCGPSTPSLTSRDLEERPGSRFCGGSVVGSSTGMTTTSSAKYSRALQSLSQEDIEVVLSARKTNHTLSTTPDHNGPVDTGLVKSIVSTRPSSAPLLSSSSHHHYQPVIPGQRDPSPAPWEMNVRGERASSVKKQPPGGARKNRNKTHVSETVPSEPPGHEKEHKPIIRVEHYIPGLHIQRVYPYSHTTGNKVPPLRVFR
eukprot:PhF_6_TR5659/c0_g1_i2/m.8311